MGRPSCVRASYSSVLESSDVAAWAGNFLDCDQMQTGKVVSSASIGRRGKMDAMRKSKIYRAEVMTAINTACPFCGCAARR